SRELRRRERGTRRAEGQRVADEAHHRRSEKMQLKRILTVLSLAAAFGTTSLAMQPTAEAGNACKRVKFKFKNEHRFNSKIKVTKVKVYDQGDGRWRTENVSDKECNQGSTCTTSGDNLTNLEQERITKIRFIYKYLEAD